MRAAIALGALVLALSTSATAAAQSEASSTGKGITGGALLGAEAVMITEAALGVRTGWAYLIGGAAGAAGGGVGGYFLESTSARTNMYVLAAGMALVIPTTVAVLNTTAYEPPAEYTEDRGPIDQPVDNPPAPSEGAWQPDARHRTSPYSVRPSRTAAAGAPTGLLGITDRLVTLSVPAIRIGDVFSDAERATFGVGRETELLMSMLDVRF